MLPLPGFSRPLPATDPHTCVAFLKIQAGTHVRGSFGGRNLRTPGKNAACINRRARVAQPGRCLPYTIILSYYTLCTIHYVLHTIQYPVYSVYYININTYVLYTTYSIHLYVHAGILVASSGRVLQPDTVHPFIQIRHRQLRI